MKAIKLLAVAALMAVSTSASAQFASGSKSSSSAASDGWSSFWVEYNSVKVTFNKGIDDETCTGFSAGYSKAFSISAGSPIFLEAGIGAQYTSKSDFADMDDVDFSMISAKVPINLIYDFELPNSSIRIDPYVGLALRYNISAKWSDDGDDINLFDKDDMGGNKNTFKRFQAGWQLGVKARFGGGFTVGAPYGSNFSNIWEPDLGEKVKGKVSTTSLSIGYCF